MNKDIYNKLISNYLKQDVITYSNAKNLVNVALISIVAIPFYAAIYYFFNDINVSYLLLILSLFFLCSILIIKIIGSLTIAREIFISSLFLSLLWISYITGGYESAATIWLILPPLLAIVFGNIRSGICWGFASIAGFIVLFLLKYLKFPLPNHIISNELLLHFYSYCGLIFVIFLLAYFFDYGKKEAVLKLEITQRESDYLAEKAREATRIKNEFLENMSHELRTPLNGIVSFAELLSSNQNNRENVDEFCKIILFSAKNLTNMVENMLNMSQVKFDYIEFSPISTNLRKLIEEVKIIHSEEMLEKDLSLTIFVDPAINLITIDSNKLRIMLSSLLSNAIKFSHNKKVIEIRASLLEKNEINIEIEDHGIGIKNEDLDKLFVPFTQLDMSMSKKYQGIGIGLALTRRLAEAQGGRVGVKSELGKGSTFFVVLKI